MRSCGETVAEREASLIAALKDAGLRLTHQRLEIVRELADARDHPDAEQLFRRVQARVPTIALDTVYRTLAIFVERGLVERITTPRATRFDPDLVPHYHFVCTRCGNLRDVEPEIATVLAPDAIPDVGEVRSVRVELHGVCVVCSGHGLP